MTLSANDLGQITDVLDELYALAWSFDAEAGSSADGPARILINLGLPCEALRVRVRDAYLAKLREEAT